MVRITEPFVKISYALWLVSKGAYNIEISVDGAEPEPEKAGQILILKGYQRKPVIDSKVNYTGIFSYNGVNITISAKPRVDIKADFRDGKTLFAECKGEPTPSGVNSGSDLTAFYTALGQLIFTANDEVKSELALVMPNTSRLKDIVSRFSKNIRLRKLGIWLVLVDESGNVTQISPN